MKKYIYGILLSFILALISSFLNAHVLSFMETLTIGIMIAIIIRNTVGVKDLFIPGVTFTAKEILKWGIILLGFRLNYITLSQLGLPVLFMIVFIVISGQLLAFFIGKGFGVKSFLEHSLYLHHLKLKKRVFFLKYPLYY